MPTRKKVAKLSRPERRQEHEAKLHALQAAIDEGDASGVAKGNVFGRVREKLKLLKTLRSHLSA